MPTVETRHAIDPKTARGFDTAALRRHFRLGDLFGDGAIRRVYTRYDRMIGGAVPAGGSPTLDEALRTDPDRNRAILDRIPAGRRSEPEDIGGTAVFLASAARYLHGAVIPGDGGWRAR